jgi:hypothetical protein
LAIDVLLERDHRITLSRLVIPGIAAGAVEPPTEGGLLKLPLHTSICQIGDFYSHFLRIDSA